MSLFPAVSPLALSYAVAVVVFAVLIGAWLRDRRRAARSREEAEIRAQELKRAYLRLEAAHHRVRAAQNRLVQAEKMASLGALTAGIAHELRNPLNFVTNFATLTQELADELYAAFDAHPHPVVVALRSELTDVLADLRLNTARICDHGQRADRIIRSMMQHAEPRSGERAETAVNELVEDYVRHAHHGWQARHPGSEVVVERAYGAEVGRAPVVPQEVGRVLLNLLSNAFDAATSQAAIASECVPTVRISTEREDYAVVIRVMDNGVGMTPEVAQRAFEPFFTTKPAGEGTGLGLSISFDIIANGHGGQLTIESQEGVGTTFTVRLPVGRRRLHIPADSTAAILHRAERLSITRVPTAQLIAA